MAPSSSHSLRPMPSPTTALLLAALETVATTLGLTLSTPHEVEAASVGGGLVDSRVTVVGAGVFDGEDVVASLGAMVPEPSAIDTTSATATTRRRSRVAPLLAARRTCTCSPMSSSRSPPSSAARR